MIGMLIGGYVGLLILGWWLAYRLGRLVTQVEDLRRTQRVLWHIVNGFQSPYEDRNHPDRWPLPTDVRDERTET